NVETKIYGGPADLWGNTWTPTDVNDPGFGVAIAAQGNGTSSTNTIPTAQVDYIEVRVFYQAQDTLGPILRTPTISFGNIYFGTTRRPSDDGGRFYAINQDDGSAQWLYYGWIETTDNPTGGTFALTYGSQTTPPL